MKKIHFISMGLLSIFLLMQGCSATKEEKPTVSLENDPRIGDKVHQACFINSIRSWSSVDNDDNALLIHLNSKKKYKLNLIGTCDADWAMYMIAIIGKTGSSCVQRGDKLKTDANTMRGMSCTIMSINEWHPEKLLAPKEEEVQQ